MVWNVIYVGQFSSSRHHQQFAHMCCVRFLTFSHFSRTGCKHCQMIHVWIHVIQEISSGSKKVNKFGRIKNIFKKNIFIHTPHHSCSQVFNTWWPILETWLVGKILSSLFRSFIFMCICSVQCFCIQLFVAWSCLCLSHLICWNAVKEIIYETLKNIYSDEFLSAMTLLWKYLLRAHGKILWNTRTHVQSLHVNPFFGFQYVMICVCSHVRMCGRKLSFKWRLRTCVQDVHFLATSDSLMPCLRNSPFLIFGWKSTKPKHNTEFVVCFHSICFFPHIRAPHFALFGKLWHFSQNCQQCSNGKVWNFKWTFLSKTDLKRKLIFWVFSPVGGHSQVWCDCEHDCEGVDGRFQIWGPMLHFIKWPAVLNWESLKLQTTFLSKSDNILVAKVFVTLFRKVIFFWVLSPVFGHSQVWRECEHNCSSVNGCL